MNTSFGHVCRHVVEVIVHNHKFRCPIIVQKITFESFVVLCLFPFNYANDMKLYSLSYRISKGFVLILNFLIIQTIVLNENHMPEYSRSSENGSNFVSCQFFINVFRFTWIIAYPYRYRKEIRLPVDVHDIHVGQLNKLFKCEE